MAKASAGEMRLLSELRAKELKDVPPSEFAIIEREVQANGFKGIKGTTAQLVFNAIRKRDKAEKLNKAVSVKSGDMVSWQSSGGSAQGKVVRVVSNGKVNVPDSSFTITGTEDDPAVLIQLYRDGKPTETKVGHKMSTLRKSESVEKHGNHDQGSHGAWANGKYNPDDSEGEDASEPKNYGPTKTDRMGTKDDSEGEFEDLNYDDPKWMDSMDILRPSRITPSQRYTTSAKELRDRLIAMKTSK